MAITGAVPALAADATLGPAERALDSATVAFFGSSRLGCSQGAAMWAAGPATSQCAFDSAVRGARINARQEFGAGSIEAYATVARGVAGAFTPDQLLIAPDRRSSEAASLFLVGLKGSAFDSRLKMTAEFTRTSRVIDELVNRDWALAGRESDGGTSALLRFDARLVNTRRFSWSMSGQYRSVSEDFSVGRSTDLARYAAMPGTQLSLSTAAAIGAARLTAGLEQRRTPYGDSASRKAGLDIDGVSLRWVARDTRVRPAEGSTLVDGRTRTNSAFVDLDTHMLAASLLPELGELPVLVPVTVGVTVRSGVTENRYEASRQHYRRSSLGIDAGWETPLGETALGYWRDQSIGQTADFQSRSTETFQLSHSVRRGNWRFGLDASLTRSSGAGANGYDDRSLSFGQSVAYSTPGGPELRLQLGQDRGVVRMTDDSYASSDTYSQVTASLDLSRYLQKRFERDDLRLTLDYRRAFERSDSEISLGDELVERWLGGDRREGLLMSFGMKL